MQNHEAWIKIAEEDLAAAKALLRSELLSPSVYHSHQAAEKSLKAFLIFKKYSLVKTHDLVQLIELSMKLDKEFEKIVDEADQLNPFSTKFRYPSEFDIPDHADAALAIKQAQKIMKFVCKKILKLNTGQISFL